MKTTTSYLPTLFFIAAMQSARVSAKTTPHQTKTAEPAGNELQGAIDTILQFEQDGFIMVDEAAQDPIMDYTEDKLLELLDTSARGFVESKGQHLAPSTTSGQQEFDESSDSVRDYRPQVKHHPKYTDEELDIAESSAESFLQAKGRHLPHAPPAENGGQEQVPQEFDESSFNSRYRPQVKHHHKYTDAELEIAEADAKSFLQAKGRHLPHADDSYPKEEQDRPDIPLSATDQENRDSAKTLYQTQVTDHPKYMDEELEIAEADAKSFLQAKFRHLPHAPVWEHGNEFHLDDVASESANSFLVEHPHTHLITVNTPPSLESTNEKADKVAMA